MRESMLGSSDSYLPNDILVKMMAKMSWKDLFNLIRTNRTIYKLFSSPAFRNLIIKKRQLEFPDKLLLGDPVMDYYKSKEGIFSYYFIVLIRDNKAEIFKTDKSFASKHDYILKVLGEPPRKGSVYYVAISDYQDTDDRIESISIHDTIESASERLNDHWMGVRDHVKKYHIEMGEPKNESLRDASIEIGSFSYDIVYPDPQSQYERLLLRLRFP